MTAPRWCGAVFAVAVAFANCSACGSDPTDVQPMVLRLMERLKPDDGRVAAFSGVRRDSSGVHASWEVESGMTWPEYTLWVSARVPPEFKPGGLAGHAEVVFRKPAEADVYLLRVTPIATASPSRVQVTFEGHPY